MHDLRTSQPDGAVSEAGGRDRIVAVRENGAALRPGHGRAGPAEGDVARDPRGAHQRDDLGPSGAERGRAADRFGWKSR